MIYILSKRKDRWAISEQLLFYFLVKPVIIGHLRGMQNELSPNN